MFFRFLSTLMTIRIIVCSLALVAATALLASPLPEVAPPQLTPPDESVIKLTLHVRAGANEDGDGSDASPFPSVQQAISAAQKAAEPARILIGPGVYRETVNLVGSDSAEAHLLVIEAVQAGTAIISGSDVFADWTPVPGSPGRFSHGWKYNFGWETNPWPGLMPMDSQGFRHELLFIDGKPSRQVFAEVDLVEGTYFVDEDADRILLQLANDGSPSESLVEISVRPQKDRGDHSKLVRIYNRDHVVLRGLVMHHGRASSTAAALQILGSSHLVLEDCRVEWNSGKGFGIEQTSGRHPSNVVIRRMHFDFNGFAGMGGGFHDGLIEDVTTNGNNWRGVMFGATGWAPCGWKFSGMDRVVIRRMQAVGNYASGGWFDDHITNVVIEDFTSMNNLRAGLSVEAVEGPLIVRNAFLAGNSVGLNLFDSRNVAVVDSLMVDNTMSQVKLAGSLPMSELELEKIKPAWRKNRLRKRQTPTQITLIANRIGVTEASATRVRLIEFGMRDHAFQLPGGEFSLKPTIETLTSSAAVYAHPDGASALAFPDLTAGAVTFAAWKVLTSQDGDSIFDEEALKNARDSAEEKAGVKTNPSQISDPVKPSSSQADELEL